MASVDGSRSLQCASDESILKLCDACNYEGTEAESSHFCDNCKEFLCRTCTAAHKKFKNSRNHTLLPVSQVSPEAVIGRIPCTVLCECNRNTAVTEYCENHNVVFCQTCKSTKHRRCKTESVTKKSIAYDKTEINATFQKANAVKVKIDKFLQERNTDLQNLVTLKETCTIKIHSFREELNKHLDLLEEILLTEMETFESQERRGIERHISSCAAIQQVLQTDINLLENVKTSSLMDELFTVDIKVSAHLNEYEILLHEISQETSIPIFIFERNKQLVDFQRNINELGTLTTGHAQADKLRTLMTGHAQPDNLGTLTTGHAEADKLGTLTINYAQAEKLGTLTTGYAQADKLGTLTTGHAQADKLENLTTGHAQADKLGTLMIGHAQADKPETLTTGHAEVDKLGTLTTDHAQADKLETLTTDHAQADKLGTLTTDHAQADKLGTLTTDHAQADKLGTLTTDHAQADKLETLTAAHAQADIHGTMTAGHTQADKLETLTAVHAQADILGTLTAGHTQADILGTLTPSHAQGDKSQRNFLHLQVQSSSQVDIMLLKDSFTPQISGCDIMQDGGIILCDKTNKKLKLLDSSFTLYDSLDLRAWPWDVSVVNTNKAIITLPYVKQLQYIEVLPKLKSARVIQLDRKCWGVHVAGEEIYVSVHDEKRGTCMGEVRIVNFNGNLIRRIEVNTDGSFMFETPYHLTISQQSRNVYVSDRDKSTITCLNSDGVVVYRYTDQNLEWARGVVTDNEDNILVCGSSSHNVQIVTADNRKSSTLLTAKDGIEFPYSVAYRQTDGTLIVGCCSQKKLFVYKLA